MNGSNPTRENSSPLRSFVRLADTQPALAEGWVQKLARFGLLHPAVQQPVPTDFQPREEHTKVNLVTPIVKDLAEIEKRVIGESALWARRSANAVALGVLTKMPPVAPAQEKPKFVLKTPQKLLSISQNPNDAPAVLADTTNQPIIGPDGPKPNIVPPPIRPEPSIAKAYKAKPEDLAWKATHAKAMSKIGEIEALWGVVEAKAHP